MEESFQAAMGSSGSRPAPSPPLDVLVQVNVSGEVTKSGVSPPQAVALAQAVAGLPRLRLRGIMGIPAPDDDPVRQRAAFATLRACFDACRAAGLAVDTLSMGMSADLEAAIAEGSTQVRVGTAGDELDLTAWDVRVLVEQPGEENNQGRS